tara:strand:+ start:1519 stop:1620 length:102 start_codon:yes stop_codon:yes gene_type:complete
MKEFNSNTPVDEVIVKKSENKFTGISVTDKEGK